MPLLRFQVVGLQCFTVMQDSRLTVEKYKTGFLMPSDIPFEEQESSTVNGNVSGPAGESPPVSTGRGRSRSAIRVESLRSTMSSGSTRSRKRAGFFSLFGRVCCHLRPEALRPRPQKNCLQTEAGLKTLAYVTH